MKCPDRSCRLSEKCQLTECGLGSGRLQLGGWPVKTRLDIGAGRGGKSAREHVEMSTRSVGKTAEVGRAHCKAEARRDQQSWLRAIETSKRRAE